MIATNAVAYLEQLFMQHGDQRYDDARAESVSAREHALQCAQLAEWAGARPSLVAAALLHDIGHFLAVHADDRDDAHERRALPLLQTAFGDEVAEPVRLHVEAKRYLVFAEPAYRATLSPASIHSLGLQGGPMTAAEAQCFERTPYAADAVALRRWDDCAKEPDRRTPTLPYYLALVGEVSLPAAQATRLPRE
jgi:phosphonate degradation associated HDIG domain protein